MSSDKVDNGFPLDSLLSFLEEEGFALTTKTRIEIFRMLYALPSEQALNFEALSTLIGPIVCKNEKDQIRFKAAFAEYSRQNFSKHQDDPGLVFPEGILPDNAGNRSAKRRYGRWQFLIGALLLIASVLIYFFALPKQPEKQEQQAPQTSIPVVIQCDSLPDPLFIIEGGDIDLQQDVQRFQNDPVLFFNLTNRLDTSQHFEWDFGDGSTDTLTNDTIVTHRFNRPGKYIITLVAGYSNGCSKEIDRELIIVPRPIYQTFISVRQLYPKKDQTQDVQEIVLPSWKLKKWRLLAAIIATWLLLEFIVWVVREWMRRKNDFQSVLNYGNEAPFYIPYRNLDKLIRPSNSYFNLANRLRGRSNWEKQNLVLADSLRATIRNMGLPVLRYQTGTVASSYLILVQEGGVNTLQRPYFDALIGFLHREEVELKPFYFNTDLNNCWNKNHPKGISLFALKGLYPHSRLIVIGDNRLLVDPLSMTASSSLSHLSHWREKLFLSTTPLARWSWEEQYLEKYCPVAPAFAAFEDIIPEVFAHSEEFNVRASLRLFQAKQAELFNTFSEDVDELEQSLGSTCWTWLKTLSIFPAVRWEVLLKIGHELGRDYFNAPIVTFENIALLLQVPGLRNGILSDNLREKLLLELKNASKVEAIARRAALTLLQETNVPNTAFAIRDKQTEMAVHQAFLEPGNRQNNALIRYLLDKDLLDHVHSRQLRHLQRFKPKLKWRFGMGLLMLIPILLLLYLSFFNDKVLDNSNLAFFYERIDPVSPMTSPIDSAVYYNNLGVDAFDNHQYNQAREAWNHALYFRPVYPLTEQNLKILEYQNGLNQYQQGHFEKAAEEWGNYSPEFNDSVSVYLLHGRGVALFNIEQPSAAFAIEDSLLSIRPDFYESYPPPNLNTLLGSLRDSTKRNQGILETMSGNGEERDGAEQGTEVVQVGLSIGDSLAVRAQQYSVLLDQRLSGDAHLLDSIRREVEELDLSKHEDLRSINGIQTFENLRSLKLSGQQNIEDIHLIGELRNLEYLSLTDCNIQDISFLRSLTSLRLLYIGSNRINSLDDLSALRNLETLSIKTNPGIESLNAIDKLPLKELVIGHNTGIPQTMIRDYIRSHPNVDVDKNQ